MRHTCIFSFLQLPNALALHALHEHVTRRERKKVASFDGELDNFQQPELILIRFVRSPIFLSQEYGRYGRYH
jgi:hypothetical protein